MVLNVHQVLAYVRTFKTIFQYGECRDSEQVYLLTVDMVFTQQFLRGKIMSNGEIRLGPADIFQEAVEYLYNYFEPLGYKLLKSNIIKKKSGQLTYEISISGSYNNYIDYMNHCGSVALEVSCHISMKKEYVFSFCFSAPMSSCKRFEILSGDLKCYKPILDVIWLKIQKHFLSFVEGLENNPLEQLKTLNLLPEVHAEDASWFYELKRPLVEYLGDADTLAQYDANCEEYYSTKNTVQRLLQGYIYYMKSKFHINPNMQLKAGYLYDLCDRIYHTLQNAEIEGDYWKEEYKQVKNITADNLVDLAIGTVSLYNIFNYHRKAAMLREQAPDLIQELDAFRNEFFLKENKV